MTILTQTPRIALIKGRHDISSTDTLFEYVRRTIRPSADIYELFIWKDQLEINGKQLRLVQAFDPHCIMTPEIIDAIRALSTSIPKEESFERTNKALNMLKPGIYP